MPQNYNKQGKYWSKDNIEKDLLESHCGNTIRGTAAKYSMSEGILQMRARKQERGESIGTQGFKPILMLR